MSQVPAGVNHRDLPSVCDTEETSLALRISPSQVRKLTADLDDPEQMADPQLLHRLRYPGAGNLYDIREIRRFLRAHTGFVPAGCEEES